MASTQGPPDNKSYTPSVLSQDTLVASETTSLHPPISNAEGATDRPIRGTEPQPARSDNYHYVSTRVVKEIPKAKTPTDTTSALSKFKRMLKPPVVKAVEALPSHEGKSYHVDEEGRIIDTTVRRAGTSRNVFANGDGGGGGGS
ncbi:hypothetical protein COL5a_010594 [Colletotrichum fioriniae]|uniref:uncharacterized protein n=1 Tax=Colletotrichum fioriniae TaxID=710243 RepID=UPI00230083E2|nr:uncharacterized protein COL516b_002894 [Colletotrichum fioriniae]KAJ0309644.1 hypothetical protein COL516b_002894 [Colletotrichum fioriniae]KAJ0318617.1 hypothetical protein COL5a_010594 [Colletotrichum fioriniae]KAJ3946574.1 hypothetical protein N0V96_002943 [Colletotrichum fioriniae]